MSDVKKIGKYILHIGTINEDGNLRIGQEVSLNVDFGRRSRIAKNHTATHVLNFVLRQVIGDECDQKGSLVEPSRARFDFSSTKGLTDDIIRQVEESARIIIKKNHQVYMEQVPYTEAKKIKGLRAVFGEIYPDPVRVVSIGTPVIDLLSGKSDGAEHSVEFCGGTHLRWSGEITQFVVISEESISRGVRRLVIATGSDACEALKVGEALQKKLKESIGLTGARLDSAIVEIKEEMKSKKDSIGVLHKKACNEMVDSLYKQRVIQPLVDANFAKYRSHRRDPLYKFETLNKMKSSTLE